MTINSAKQISKSTVGIITCNMIIIGALTGLPIKFGVGEVAKKKYLVCIFKKIRPKVAFLFKISDFLFLPLHVSIRLNFNG